MVRLVMMEEKEKVVLVMVELVVMVEVMHKTVVKEQEVEVVFIQTVLLVVLMGTNMVTVI